MGIDTSIYGNIKPVQIENPLENYGRLMQLQQAQQQNRLADLVYGEKQREIGGDNALASLLAGGKSGADVSQGLAAAGYGNKSMAYTKAMQEQLKQQAEIGKTKAEASYKDVEAAHKRAELIGQGLGYLKDNPTLENAQGVINHFVQIGIMPPEVAQQKLADFQRDPTPEGIKRLALMGYQGALSAKDQLPKIETHNIGGSTNTLSINPVTNKVEVINSTQNTQSPDNAATNATSRANNAATVGATIRGQNLTDSRSREANALTREGQQTQIVVDPVRGPLLINKGTGLARSAVGLDGKPVAGEVPAKREAAAKNLLPILDEADKLIDSSTGSYVGAGVDQAARVFGRATPGALSSAQLKVLEGNLMLNQPRMEGPQSDKDVMLYRQMAGQIGDSTVPNAIKKTALKTIRTLTEKYAGVAPSSPNAPVIPAGWTVKEQ